MSVEKKQTEIVHKFTVQNKFLRLKERDGYKPTVDLNDFGNDIRAVHVSEIGVLISLLMSVEKHLNGELKEPFGEEEIVLEPGQLTPTARQLIDAGQRGGKKESSLEEKLRALDVVVDEPVKRRYPTMSDRERWMVGEDIVRAWIIPGASEEFHERDKNNLHVHWPVLAKAIEKFVEVRPHDAR